MTWRARTVWQAAFALALVAHLAILYWPRTAGPTDGPGLDKVVHATTFGSVAYLGLRAGLAARWLLPLVAAHAAVSEVVQALLLPHRSGDWRDVVADLVGVALAAAAWLAANRPARASWSRDRSGAGDPHGPAAGGDTRAG